MQFLGTPNCTTPKHMSEGGTCTTPPHHAIFLHAFNNNSNIRNFMGEGIPHMLDWCSFTPPMHPPCMMHQTSLHKTPSCPTHSKHPTPKPPMIPWLVLPCMCYMNMGDMHLPLMDCNEESSSWVNMHAHGSMLGYVIGCAMEPQSQGHAPQHFFAQGMGSIPS